MHIHTRDAPEHQPGRKLAARERRLDVATIGQIEQALRRDDPAFVRRMRRVQRADRANAVTIVSFLVAAAVLLAIGLATRSWFVWLAGGVVFVAAFAVDEGYRRWVDRRINR